MQSILPGIYDSDAIIPPQSSSQNEFCSAPPYQRLELADMMSDPYQKWLFESIPEINPGLVEGYPELQFQQQPTQQHTLSGPWSVHQHELLDICPPENLISTPTNLVDGIVAPIYGSPSNPQYFECQESKPLNYEASALVQATSHQPEVYGFPGLFPLPGVAMAEPTQCRLCDVVPPLLNDHESCPKKTRQSTKQRKPASKPAWVMTIEEKLLLSLRDEESLRWKDIQQLLNIFGFGNSHIPALQMRYKRLKEKTWSINDLHFLQNLKNEIDKNEWDLVSQRMAKLGRKKIPGYLCKKKWNEIKSRNTLKRSRSTMSQQGAAGASSGTSPTLNNFFDYSTDIARGVSMMNLREC